MMYTKPRSDTRVTLVLYPPWRLLTLKYVISLNTTLPPMIRGMVVLVLSFYVHSILNFVFNYLIKRNIFLTSFVNRNDFVIKNNLVLYVRIQVFFQASGIFSVNVYV